MGRSKETYGKKEVRKKQEKKRKDKEARKLARKENANKLDNQDMIAYVDEFGNILSEPPDISQKKEVNLEDIEISIPKGSEQNEEDLLKTGVVTFFNEQKGYGFIREQVTKQNVFVHSKDIIGKIKEGNKVIFELGTGPKGLIATGVKLSE